MLLCLVLSSEYKLLSALDLESKVKYITRYITLHENVPKTDRET